MSSQENKKKYQRIKSYKKSTSKNRRVDYEEAPDILGMGCPMSRLNTPTGRKFKWLISEISIGYYLIRD